MATKVGLAKIWMTAFDWPTTKSPVWCENLGPTGVLNLSEFIANFVWKFADFCYHGSRVWSDTNFICIVKLATQKALYKFGFCCTIFAEQITDINDINSPFYRRLWRFFRRSEDDRSFLVASFAYLRSCTAWNRASSCAERHTVSDQSWVVRATRSFCCPWFSSRDCWCWCRGSRGHGREMLGHSPSNTANLKIFRPLVSNKTYEAQL